MNAGVRRLADVDAGGFRDRGQRSSAGGGRRRWRVVAAGFAIGAVAVVSLTGAQTAAASVALGSAARVHRVPSAPKPIRNGKGTHASGLSYTAQTVVIPAGVVRHQLKHVSPNGAIYTFRRAAGPLRKLKPGKIMLLKGVAVRHVKRVKRRSGKLIVFTTPAAITDLIANGTLKWNNTPVNLAKAYVLGGSAVPAAAVAGVRPHGVPAAGRFGMRAVSSHSVTIRGKTTSYDFTATFKSVGKAVSVLITIEKSSPVDLSATIKGTIRNLRSSGAINVKSSHLRRATFTAKGLRGKFTVSYSIKPLSAFGLGQAGGIKITLPAELTVPFAVGGVPFFVGLKSSFFASVGFSGFGQAVSGSYTIKYNGKGGFTTKASGTTTAHGLMHGLGKVILGAGNAVNAGPLTVIFGAQVPQFELGLGVKGLNVAGFVTLVADTGVATYGSGCDTRGLLVEASTGAEANFFGFSVPFGSTLLFKRQITSSYPSGCGVFPGF